MSLRRNIVANYASQLYMTLIGIAMVPKYVAAMGTEAYGLVGLFSVLQALFQLLDMGLTPTLIRETARFRGGATEAGSLRRLLRAMEGIFATLAILGATGLVLASKVIATRWLKVEQLPLSEVQISLRLMAGIVALRWISGLYRGAINGFERQVWLSGFNITVATARFVVVLLVFKFWGTRPVQFFSYQLAVAVFECTVLVFKTYGLIPASTGPRPNPWDWAPLRGILGFSVSVAFTGSVWVAVTQADKLLVSKLLPLSEYAYFAMAILVASGVTFIGGPISAALVPRLTSLQATGNERALLQLYRSGTELVGIVAIPVALVLSLFAEHVLLAWSGDAEITKHAAPVLRLYALGNGLLALGAFPYYLQFAKGDLKLHLLGSGLFVLVLVPSLSFAAWRHGTIGAGYAWLGTNVLYFFLWTPQVHRRLSKGLHSKWLLSVAPILVSATAVGLVLKTWVTWPGGRSPLVVVLALVSVGILAAAAAGSGQVRQRLGLRTRG